MKNYSIDGLTITTEKQGADKYIKISYPFRFGKYSEIKSDNYTFQFNLNGEIRTIQGRGEGWLDASEWLKRSAGNDWTYFAAGGYTGAYDFTGEYYVPCLPYDSNGIFGHNRFNSPEVTRAFESWHQLVDRLNTMNKNDIPAEIKDLIKVSNLKGRENVNIKTSKKSSTQPPPPPPKKKLLQKKKASRNDVMSELRKVFKLRNLTN